MVESSSITLCFYIGLYTLSYYDVMKNAGCDFMVILCIALSVFYVTPALLLRKTLLECLTFSDSKLVGEVTGYMDENKTMRKLLIDALFPHMEDHLMEHVSGKSILTI